MKQELLKNYHTHSQ
jgi:hypothetical protein